MTNLITFGLGESHSDPTKEHLGGKGYGLVEMSNLGVPVPPGVIIPTDLCNRYHAGEADVVEAAMDEFFKDHLPKFVKKFGYIPLFSVRSGSRVSMPGMMDTILNVGLDGESYDGWQERLGTDCLLDCRKRLNEMWTDVVKSELPDSLAAQLHFATKAVFDSWNNDRAIAYRDLHDYDHDWGTAVVIQAMVFGNKNEQSCSGVMFTRDPSTGENEPVGEFLPNAQGEDVVAGTHTPLDINELVGWDVTVHQQLWKLMFTLENHFGDMQDIEFTVQDGELFILQTRNGKRLPKAAFKIALDMLDEGTWDLEYALEQVSVNQYKQLSTIEITGVCPEPTGTGIAAGGSIVIGKAVFDATKAAKATSPVILIRKETDPNDVLGMAAAVGILTSTGGKTSHAAVVSRGFGKTCVVGLTEMQATDFAAIIGTEAVEEGDLVAIDGETGRVWFNVVPEIATLASGHVGHELMRRVLVSQGKAEVGELDDLSNDRPIVIRAATWSEPMVELRALKKVCGMDGIDLRQVTIDLRDAIELNADDQTLFELAGVETTSDEKGRITWAEEFEGTRKRGATKGSGFRYLTSTPTNLPGVEQIKSLDALMHPGVVSLDPDMGSPDTLKTIMQALKAQGHDVATLYAGAARLDEVAFDVLQ